MWTIDKVICLLFLIIVAVRDIQIKRISLCALITGGILSLIYQVFLGKMDLLLILGGVLTGGVFLLISKVTREGVGYGDSFLILILGIYLGFYQLLMVLSMAFFLLLCVSVPVLWLKKMSRKYTLPFLPFLTGGYLCFILTGGINS